MSSARALSQPSIAKRTPARVRAPKELFRLSDLLEDLGGIDPRRVILKPPPGTAKQADMLRINESKITLCELVDGTLVEKGMGYEESGLALLLGHALLSFLDRHDLGVVAGESGGLRLRPGLIRVPDVSFISWDALPGREWPKGPVPKLAPTLAVEILSKSNTKAEIDRKIREYFAAGTQLVWIIDPKKQTVRVHTSPLEFKLLAKDDMLDGGTVLPGFRLKLKDFFEKRLGM